VKELKKLMKMLVKAAKEQAGAPEVDLGHGFLLFDLGC